MTACPCGSQSDYTACCEPVHQQHAHAQQPEQLMRARYSAHVLGLVDFVIETYHPSCHAEDQREGIQQSVHSEWKKLDVIGSEDGSDKDEGYVTFSAHFVDQGAEYCMTERSRFLRQDGLWYYIDGEFPSQEETNSDPRLNHSVKELKVGRNDPCICGSGKKFKKCCG